MPADPNRVRDIFLAAVELSPEERSGFLADACGGDAELRAEVDRLLVANADPNSILEPPSPTPAHAASTSVPSHPGTVDLPGGRSATDAFDPDVPPASHGDRDRGAPARWGDGGVCPHRSRCHQGRGIGIGGPRAPRGKGPDGRRDRHRHRRPVHAARSPRRGGDGHRLPGRARLNRSSGRWR